MKKIVLQNVVSDNDEGKVVEFKIHSAFKLTKSGVEVLGKEYIRESNKSMSLDIDLSDKDVIFVIVESCVEGAGKIFKTILLTSDLRVATPFIAVQDENTAWEFPVLGMFSEIGGYMFGNNLIELAANVIALIDSDESVETSELN